MEHRASSTAALALRRTDPPGSRRRHRRRCRSWNLVLHVCGDPLHDEGPVLSGGARRNPCRPARRPCRACRARGSRAPYASRRKPSTPSIPFARSRPSAAPVAVPRARTTWRTRRRCRLRVAQEAGVHWHLAALRLRRVCFLHRLLGRLPEDGHLSQLRLVGKRADLVTELAGHVSPPPSCRSDTASCTGN